MVSKKVAKVVFPTRNVATVGFTALGFWILGDND